MRFDELGLRNRRAVPMASLPLESVEAFRRTALDAVEAGWRVAAFFGMPSDHGATALVMLLAHDQRGELGATTTTVTGAYPALTPDCPQVHYFEREIAEQCAILPQGHPCLKPVRRHAPDQGPPGTAQAGQAPPAHPFNQSEREDVHEVAVGPVHAGIIEPGHFRHRAQGEEILGLEIALGYQHRGVERLLEQVDRLRSVLIAESIAGDTVIGHAEAHCSALEALARSRKTPRAQAIRGLALELERLANHLGDLGAIANDVAYQPAAAYFGRMRGECLNLLLMLSGNRYGRGLVRPGGVRIDLPPEMAAEMIERLDRLRAEVGPVASLMLDSASVQARLDGIGVLTSGQCLELGIVGPPARACEIARDVRQDHPYGLFRFAYIPVATAWAGDVLARTLVRRLEVQRSLDFVIEQLAGIPRGAVRVECAGLHPEEFVAALSEGWRGQILHVVITDAAGGIRRHKVIDPSFHNWSALAAVMPGNQISDFPLCNKSFNLSYAGHDL